jgi:hypothetical protein
MRLQRGEFQSKAKVKVGEAKMKDQNIETIFEGPLTDSDLTWVTLRGHVFIEAMMRRSIQQRVQHPDAIQRLGLKFTKLVHLAIALDAIPDDFAPSLFKLDALRNRLGHELGITISWEAAYGLAKALPKEWFSWLESRYDGDEKFVHYIRDVVNLLALVLYFGNDCVLKAMVSDDLATLRDRFRGEVLVSNLRA